MGGTVPCQYPGRDTVQCFCTMFPLEKTGQSAQVHWQSLTLFLITTSESTTISVKISTTKKNATILGKRPCLKLTSIQLPLHVAFRCIIKNLAHTDVLVNISLRSHLPPWNDLSKPVS